MDALHMVLSPGTSVEVGKTIAHEGCSLEPWKRLHSWVPLGPEPCFQQEAGWHGFALLAVGGPMAGGWGGGVSTDTKA